MAADREQDIKNITNIEIAKGVISQLAIFPEISQEDTIEAGLGLEPKLEIVRDLRLTVPDIDLTLEKINLAEKEKTMTTDLADKLRSRLEEQRKFAELKNPPTFRQKLTESLKYTITDFVNIDTMDKIGVISGLVASGFSIDLIVSQSNLNVDIFFSAILALGIGCSRLILQKGKKKSSIL